MTDASFHNKHPGIDSAQGTAEERTMGRLVLYSLVLDSETYSWHKRGLQRGEWLLRRETDTSKRLEDGSFTAELFF